jgi:3-oxoacyl-[acyl-carrier-protein] synthase II
MKRVPVVITGIGVICPLGRNKDEYWANLIDGRSGVRAATDHEFVGMENVFLGEVEDSWVAEQLPAGADGSVRMNALALVAAEQALTDSGLDLGSVDRDLFGVVVGQCQATAGPTVGSYLPFHEPTDAVARHFGLAGPRTVISTACAAGGNAVGMGRDMLWDGSAEVVLAGGVDDLQKGSHLGFELLGAISPGPTAPYSKSDGLSLGEGSAFVVLETKEHAEARGATILAEVAGYGLSADAYHATAPDPTGKGPLRAVSRALAQAGLTSDDISYVNGHGTGTPTNDKMERKAMKSFFGARLPDVPMSSTKSALGHSLGASGAIEAVTCVLALQHGQVPPTVNFQGEPAEGFDYIPNKGREAQVDITLSNNYAFGGNNCSLVLARPGRLDTPPEQELTKRKVVVSGLGIVSGFGLGIDAWREGVARGESAIAPITKFDGEKYGASFGVEPFPLGSKPLAASGLWRHLATYGRQALAATTFAFQDAGLKTNGPGRENVGLIFATGYGPIETAVELMMGMNSPEGASALSFANATVNAAAGAVCQALTLRGPTTTVASGGASAVLALDTAMQLIQTGQADRLVLLAIDDFCEAVAMERSKHDPLAADGKMRPYDTDRHGTVLGSAAVAILLEVEDVVDARGGRKYAEVTGVAHAGVNGRNDQETAERVLRRLLERTGTPAGDVDLVAGSGTGADRDVAELAALGAVFGEDLMLTAPKSLTGECEAASGGVNLLTAALSVAEGLVPATANLENPLLEHPVRHVLEPATDAKVSRAIATASTPTAAFAAAMFAPVAG